MESLINSVQKSFSTFAVLKSVWSEDSVKRVSQTKCDIEVLCQEKPEKLKNWNPSIMLFFTQQDHVSTMTTKFMPFPLRHL